MVNQILSRLPVGYPAPVVLCLHRLRDVRKGFIEALSIKSNLPVLEAIDKEQLEPGHVYLAPANYHFSVKPGVGYFWKLTRLELTNYHFPVEPRGLIALSSEEAVNYSRPAIDITFEPLGMPTGKRRWECCSQAPTATAPWVYGFYAWPEALHRPGSRRCLYADHVQSGPVHLHRT